jgi:hypothetical protein
LPTERRNAARNPRRRRKQGKLHQSKPRKTGQSLEPRINTKSAAPFAAAMKGKKEKSPQDGVQEITKKEGEIAAFPKEAEGKQDPRVTS